MSTLWESSRLVTYPYIAPNQARLTKRLLGDELPKKKMCLISMGGIINAIKVGYYTPPLKGQDVFIGPTRMFLLAHVHVSTADTCAMMRASTGQHMPCASTGQHTPCAT